MKDSKNNVNIEKIYYYNINLSFSIDFLLKINFTITNIIEYSIILLFNDDPILLLFT